jgi:streptogramin lyase
MLKQLSSLTRVVVVLGLVGSHAWADITEFALPNGGSGPGPAILVGPDGNLWFTELLGDRIGRFSLADSTITEFQVSRPPRLPVGNGNLLIMTVGPDNNLWFVEFDGNRIGTITLDGNLTEFDLPSPDSAPAGIALGPDGNLWFTEYLGNRIGMITPQGNIAEFPIPTANSGPNEITAGPDGNLWFTEYDGDRIGTITPSGQFTEFKVRPYSQPFSITGGPDGNVWFTTMEGNHVGRITPNGDVTLFDIPHLLGFSRITVGPEGNLWVTENNGNRIGQISTDGVLLAEYDVPTPGSLPLGITTGPDGNIWFTEFSGNKLGRLYVYTPANHLLITAAATAVSGTPFDVTVTALDPYGKVDSYYQGTVTFSSTDPDSGVVLPADYTFTTGDGGDSGVHTFSGGVTLVTLGDQTFTITDTVSGITGSVTITVGPGP